MSADIRINVGLPGHPKTKKLIRKLGETGAWRLVCLFIWVAQNRQDGDLSGMSDEDVEIAIDWSDTPGRFVAALIEVGFLDGAEGHRKIHDWAEHNPWVAGSTRRTEHAKSAARTRWAKQYGDSKSPTDAPNRHATGDNQQCGGHDRAMPTDIQRIRKSRLSNTPNPNPNPIPAHNPSIRGEDDGHTDPWLEAFDRHEVAP